MEEFGDDLSCARHLARQRWPGDSFARSAAVGRAGGSNRPWVWECADRETHRIDRKGRARTDCRHQVSLIAGTVMHGTRLPLSTWFLAAYLVATHKKGISALQLWPKIGVGSYKTAWLLLHKLRRAMVDPDRRRFPEPSRSMRRTSPTGTATIPRSSEERTLCGQPHLVIGAVEVRDGQYPGRVRLERLDDEADETGGEGAAARFRLPQHLAREPYRHRRQEGLRGPARTEDHTAIPHSRNSSIPPHVSMRWIHVAFSNFHTWGLRHLPRLPPQAYRRLCQRVCISLEPPPEFRHHRPHAARHRPTPRPDHLPGHRRRHDRVATQELQAHPCHADARARTDDGPRSPAQGLHLSRGTAATACQRRFQGQEEAEEDALLRPSGRAYFGHATSILRRFRFRTPTRLSAAHSGGIAHHRRIEQ